MATVTRKFRDDFDCWAADRLARGQFTPAEMEEFRDLLRRDLAPGPDQLREGLTVIIAAGVEVPATIDDHNERYRMWGDYFAAEAEAIRALQRRAA
jgi:hypothetical protein